MAIIKCNICGRVFMSEESRTMCIDCEEKSIPDVIITNSPTLEGYRITEYLGVYCEECAMGTGYFKQLFASLSSIAGTESRSFQEKMKETRLLATKYLKQTAREMSADAIICFNFDYETIGDLIFTVIASGTLVTIEPTDSE